jgi:CRISPR/Cas system CSM-associated protein Csm3 (group 7 of RAMP superfamily)
LKGQDGLPYLPGKSLKGHLRESTNWLKGVIPGVDDDWQSTLLGSASSNDDAVTSKKASLFISNAFMHPKQSELLLKEKNSTLLFRYLSSTSINDYGVANDQSLRNIEVAVPLDLFGLISGVEQKDVDLLRLAFGAIKNLGAGKTRGLGKCKIELIIT